MNEATSVTAGKTFDFKRQARPSPDLQLLERLVAPPLLRSPRPFPRITHRAEKTQYPVTGLPWTWLWLFPVLTWAWAKYMLVRIETHGGLRWGWVQNIPLLQPPHLSSIFAWPEPLSVSTQKSPSLATKYQSSCHPHLAPIHLPTHSYFLEPP